MHFCPHVFATRDHDHQSRYRRWNWIAIFHVLTIKMIKTGIHINTRRESLENSRDPNVDRIIQRQMTTDSRNPLGKWNSVSQMPPNEKQTIHTDDDARILHDPLTSHEKMCSSLTATLETKRSSQRHTPYTCPRISLRHLFMISSPLFPVFQLISQQGRRILKFEIWWIEPQWLRIWADEHRLRAHVKKWVRARENALDTRFSADPGVLCMQRIRRTKSWSACVDTSRFVWPSWSTVCVLFDTEDLVPKHLIPSRYFDGDASTIVPLSEKNSNSDLR